MAGRHGKLSGSPYHVATVRNLAGERFGTAYSPSTPPCKYRNKTGLCELPQNKITYKKHCQFKKCKYLIKESKMTRKSCLYMHFGECIYKKLTNCTKTEDLAYCCSYYKSKNENKELYERLQRDIKYNTLYSNLIASAGRVIKKMYKFEKEFKKNRSSISNRNYFKMKQELDDMGLSNLNNINPSNILEIRGNINIQEWIDESVEKLELLQTIYFKFLSIVKENSNWLEEYACFESLRHIENCFNDYTMISKKYIDFIKTNYK